VSSVLQRIFLGGLNGALIGFGCISFEFAFLSNRSIRWLRRVPLIAIVMIRAFSFGLCVLFGLVTPQLLLLGEQVWDEPLFQLSFWVSSGIALLISMAIELIQLLGREATISIFTGRYRRPRQENRIVMFADLIGSTALAEKLGDFGFHELLGDVAYDLSVPIETHGGNIHRYIGDAVIVTWPMGDKRNYERSIDCAMHIAATLDQKGAAYRRRYGQAMRIRIAIHCGPVAAGEVGAWKKEIALLGDTMNTAARIESAAREFGAMIVLSDDVRECLPRTTQERLKRMPDYKARGKHDNLKLWAIDDSYAV